MGLIRLRLQCLVPNAGTGEVCSGGGGVRSGWFQRSCQPIGRRWSPRVEQSVDERRLLAQTRAFYDALFDAFPALELVRDGELSGPDLRTHGSSPSLLGSVTMIRALASAWRELRLGDEDANGMTPEEITAFFATLPMDAGHKGPDDPAKSVPVLDARWLETGLFYHPYVAPVARQGDVKKLVRTIVSWGREFARETA